MSGAKTAPNRRLGGRGKGTPNKATKEARELFKRMLDDLAPDVEDWIRAAADEDPSKGADLVLKLAEFCVPKLSRAEVTGKDGEGLSVALNIVRTVRA